jgi:hypothetical protein
MRAGARLGGDHREQEAWSVSALAEVEGGKKGGLTMRLTILLVAGIAAFLTALGSVAAAVCGPSWSTVPSAPEIAVPRDIAAIASDEVWIVGRKAPGNQGIPTGAEHWDGTSWTLFPTPNKEVGTNSENALNGVDALTTNNVWAVGYSKAKAAAPYKTLVERWNGAQWSVVSSPNAGTNTNVLVNVDALRSDLAWAVGYYRQDSLRRTLLMRWNGTQWSTAPSPNSGTLSNALLGVAAVAPNDIWAVGYKSSGTGYRSLILHYNGTGWNEVGAPSFGTGDNILTSISAVSGQDVWAAGYFVEGAQHKSLTLRYDGTAWRRVPSANAAGGVTAFRDIEASSPTSAWAVGFEYQANRTNPYVASSQHWNGTSWSGFPTAVRAKAGNSEMLGVAKAPDTSQVWAAGSLAATSGAVGDVENICLSGSSTAAAPAQNTDASATGDVSGFNEATKKPVSNPTASAAPSASVDGTALAIPARAVDRAVDAGISELTSTHGAVIDDFNNDNLPDIFLNRHFLVPRFYLNDGNGHFTETHQGTFRLSDFHGCDAADVNQDGLEDLFCTVGAGYGTQVKRNLLYIQLPDHTFVNRSAQYGVLEPFGRGRTGTFVRANGDAFPDLFVANERERADGMPSPNRLFMNQAGSAYRYAPEYGLERELGDGADTGGDAAVADIDKDGWQDLLAGTDSGLRLYRNDRGTRFTDVTGSAGLGQSAVDATLADVNGDTWPDVVAVTSTQLSVLHNTNGSFSLAFSAPLSSGLAVAAGDVNGDGRSDLYVMQKQSATSTNAPDRVYLNDGTGSSFSLMSSIPSTSQGAAESVWPIDHDGNGLTDFLVLNGTDTARGPVQLISFYPAS